ncbi:hypothetical protein [Streptomyces sp. NBC_01429]|uniref:hypothetical protein n=1 Tax=Streptomyces sp. NBC_01429 TaxID=2903862 RepID=UPI002E294394|nr:hypothetical protein [Streptomyces sp. NBC_01429]
MVVNIPDTSGDTDQPGEARTDPSTTLAGWRHFLNTDPAVFDTLDEQQWRSMSQPLREVDDEARIAYHSELQVIRTSTVKEIAHQGRLLTLLNQREHGARRGMIVSGDWTTGKTTALPGSAGRERRWACRRCAAAHAPGQRIALFAPAHHHHVCLRHSLWVGKAAHRPQDQIDLAQLPGTVRAQRWHRRLLRRYGVDLITQCLHAARGFWQTLAARYFAHGHGAFHDIIRKQAGARTGWGPGLYAMAYPGMVAAMSLAVMPSWRSIVADSGHPDDIGRVLAEFQRRLPVGAPHLAGPALVGLGQLVVYGPRSNADRTW